MNIRTMTTEERERLAYAEGFTETAKLLGALDDMEHERDILDDELENLNHVPVRYFVIDFDFDDGPEVIEVREYEFIQAEGRITYKRHTVSENGCNQICLTKGLDA